MLRITFEKDTNYVDWQIPPGEVPSDNRDVVALVRKPIYNEKEKRMELMKVIEVIHCEMGEEWFLNGIKLKVENVLKWCDIPDGWQE